MDIFNPRNSWSSSLCASSYWRLMDGLGALGVGFFYDRVCSHGTDCAVMGQIGDLFGGVNALFAGLALAGLVFSLEATRRASAREREWERDKALVEQTRASYEWAYLALTGGKHEAEGPLRSRLAWLSAARHLLRAEKIAAKVRSDAFLMILNEHREYWRTQLHQLCGAKKLPIRFFADYSRDQLSYQPYIEYRSAMVIAEFMSAKWDDPMDEVDGHLLVEREDWNNGSLARAIEQYVIASVPGFVERHLEKFPAGRVAKERELVRQSLKRHENIRQAQQQRKQQ